MKFVFALLLSVSCVVCAETLAEKIARARSQADAALQTNKPKPKQDVVKSSDVKTQTEKQQTKPEGKKSEYVVSESDFINGRYIGKVGESKVHLDDMKKSISVAEKLAKDASKISVAETEIFLIASENSMAVSEVKPIVLAFEKVFSEVFSVDYLKHFAKRIEIKIFEDAEKDVSVNTGKTLSEINLAWKSSLKLEDFCEAMLDAVFQRICLEEKSQCNIPQWLKVALLYSVLDEIKVGITSHLARCATDVPHKSVSDIFSYKKSDFSNSSKKAHAFFLLKAFQRLADKHNFYLYAMNLVKFNLSGKQAFSEMEKLLNLPADVNADVWVGCVMLAEEYARAGGVMTMSNSELMVLQMSSIRHFENDNVISVSCDNLEKFTEEIFTEVRLKISELKLLLVKINPVYFNSLRELGLVYEAYLSGDKHRYRQKLTDFLDEFKRARNTAKTVEQSMKREIKTTKLKLD